MGAGRAAAHALHSQPTPEQHPSEPTSADHGPPVPLPTAPAPDPSEARSGAWSAPAPASAATCLQTAAGSSLPPSSQPPPPPATGAVQPQATSSTGTGPRPQPPAQPPRPGPPQADQLRPRVRGQQASLTRAARRRALGTSQPSGTNGSAQLQPPAPAPPPHPPTPTLNAPALSLALHPAPHPPPRLNKAEHDGGPPSARHAHALPRTRPRPGAPVSRLARVGRHSSPQPAKAQPTQPPRRHRAPPAT